MEPNVVVCVLSGGQDSTTCLFWAKQKFKGVPIAAISFDYGQKHSREIDCAHKIAELADVSAHVVKSLSPLMGRSPLINSETKLGQYKNPEQLPGGIEPTFIPCRNIVFLTYAANYAMFLADGLQHARIHLVTGVCDADYGGYPDCRKEFISCVEATLNQGIFGHAGYINDEYSIADSYIIIETPLMALTKAATVILADKLGCLDKLAYTHTCYEGTEIPCRECHACIIRERGFVDAGIPDPLVIKYGGDWPPSWAMRKVPARSL